MHYYQQGQVLPIGLVLLLIGMLSGYVLFNTGKVATDKMKLANTADAAAYSGTLWQARALNFQSYANRAMVANQVSIAQAVTLQSWAAYGSVASENIATVLKPIPIVNAVAEGLQRGLEVVERILSPVTQGLLALVDTVNQGLSLAQEAMFVSTFVATPDVMRTVVAETDPRFSLNTGFSGLGLTDNLNQWQSFTERYANDNAAAMDERLQMINDSRDDFTRKRNWKFFHFWFMSTPLTRHQVRREGATKLFRVDTPTGVEWEWKAKDTMSMHNRVWHWKGTKRKELTIGWAEAFANSRDSTRTIQAGACTSVNEMQRSNCARFLGINRYAEYKADIGVRSMQGEPTRIAMRHYTGVQAYRSLSQAVLEQATPPLRLKVEVSMPAGEAVGSNALGSGGQFAAPIDTPGKQVSSVSVAEVYYKRPDADLTSGAAKALEPANGYNPYWGARLSPVSDADRLLAFTLRSDTGSTAKPNGTAGGLPDNAVALSSYTERGDTGLSQLSPGGSSSLLLNAGESGLSLISDSSGSPVADRPTMGKVIDFDGVVASLETGDLDQFRKDIEKQLIDALKTQAKDMLTSALMDSVGVDTQSVDDLGARLEQAASDAVGDLTTTEAGQPFEDVIAEATMMAANLEAEFKRIREVIVRDFQSVFETERVALEAQIAPILAEIKQNKNRISGTTNEDKERTVQQVISGLAEKRAALEQEFKRKLAIALIEITHRSTDLYYMTMKEATYLVGQFMAIGEDEIKLPWLEIIEEDDTDD